MLLAVIAACAGETIEVPGETVVVEKEVIKTVEVPGETVVKEVIKEVEVPGETVVVKEVVTETVEVPGETVVVEKEVVKTVEVPGETVTVEVVKEVMVPGETVVVEKEVVKTVEVPGETVVVEKVVVQEVAGKKYVTDPTTGNAMSAPEYGGTLTYASKEEWANPDVLVANHWGAMFTRFVTEKIGFANWGIDRAEYKLAEWSTPLFAMTGSLAESWETPDDKTIVLNIRKGVQWHDKAPMDGRELTAQDIEYNFHRITGMGSGFTEHSGFTSHLHAVPLESITATDASTVVFKLKEPSLGALIGVLDDSMAWMYPPEVIKEHGDVTDWRNLVGTGPFMLTDYVEGSSITWSKNPDYWGYDEKYPQNRLPYVDEIRAPIMPEPATYLAALRSGKVDYVGSVGAANIRSVDQAESLKKTNPEIVIWRTTGASTTSTGLNVNMPPFNDIRVRKAMQMALDLETINAIYFRGYGDMTPHGQVGNAVIGYFIPFEQWPEEVKEGYRYDPEGAEALLDAAGYPRLADGIRFKTLFTESARYDLTFRELLASYWRDIGVDVEIQVYESAERAAIRKARTFEMIYHEMAYGSLANPLSPPDRFLSYRPYNSVAAEDPAYDAMFEAAAAASTIEEQQRLVKELDMYAIERHWAVWGGMSPIFEATQPWLAGFSGENAGLAVVFPRLWIDSQLKEAIGR